MLKCECVGGYIAINRSICNGKYFDRRPIYSLYLLSQVPYSSLIQWLNFSISKTHFNHLLSYLFSKMQCSLILSSVHKISSIWLVNEGEIHRIFAGSIFFAKSHCMLAQNWLQLRTQRIDPESRIQWHCSVQLIRFSLFHVDHQTRWFFCEN